jgi:hypothetical protein
MALNQFASAKMPPEKWASPASLGTVSIILAGAVALTLKNPVEFEARSGHQAQFCMDSSVR